jgi:hypothetical protein
MRARQNSDRNTRGTSLTELLLDELMMGLRTSSKESFATLPAKQKEQAYGPVLIMTVIPL